MKKIINGSTQTLLGTFNEDDLAKTVLALEKTCPEVSIDIDGDIIVFEDE